MVLMHGSFLPNLFKLTLNQNRKVRKQVCHAISNITAGTFNQIGLIVDNASYIDVPKTLFLDQDEGVFFKPYPIL